MTTNLNEFGMNFAPVAAPAVSAPPITSVSPEATEDAYDMTVGVEVAPDVSSACDHIYVSVDSCSINGYDSVSPSVGIDLVLNVSITNPENGSNSMYKLVKRLSFDKVKLALQAESQSPYQVVEAEEIAAAEAAKQAEANAAAAKEAAEQHTLRRLRAMAGLE